MEPSGKDGRGGEVSLAAPGHMRAARQAKLADAAMAGTHQRPSYRLAHKSVCNPSRQGTPMALTDRRDDSPPVQGGGTGLRFVQGVGRDGAFGKGGRGGEASLAAPGHDGMPVRSRP